MTLVLVEVAKSIKNAAVKMSNILFYKNKNKNKISFKRQTNDKQ